VIPLDIRDFSPIHLQMDDNFSSEIWRSLHDQPSTCVALARLRLRATDKDSGTENKNLKELADEMMA
jgi:hypothetical protein